MLVVASWHGTIASLTSYVCRSVLIFAAVLLITDILLGRKEKKSMEAV